LRSCTWVESAGRKNLVLMLKTADDFNNAKKLMQGVTPVSGIGDDAYYASMGAMAILYARKGNVAFNLTVGGGFPTDQQKAMEKTLALQIFSKL
jgi:hypothetical protein